LRTGHQVTDFVQVAVLEINAGTEFFNEVYGVHSDGYAIRMSFWLLIGQIKWNRVFRRRFKSNHGTP
jgi:hypothetical protein